ncbi:MAG TPA: hypothetical protein VFG86_23875 [Chloroflexota bacterium]|jgi:hypothetical protein|nr:hypothetical protein [Chloroflexota bacterium]
MDTFYQSVTTFCFTLLGLWWGVLQLRHDEWTTDPERRRLAHSVYLSFLIPGVMSLGAQLAADARWVWQVVFFVAAVGGLISALFFIRTTGAGAAPGLMRRARWLVLVLYGLIAVFAAFPDWAAVLGLKPLQVEGLVLALLVFLGVNFAWAYLAEPKRAPATLATPSD